MHCIQYYLRHISLTHYIVLITSWSSSTLIFLNFYRTTNDIVESLLNICRTTMERLLNHFRPLLNHIEHLLNIYQTTIECLSNHYRSLSNYYWTTSNIY